MNSNSCSFPFRAALAASLLLLAAACSPKPAPVVARPVAESPGAEPAESAAKSEHFQETSVAAPPSTMTPAGGADSGSGMPKPAARVEDLRPVFAPVPPPSMVAGQAQPRLSPAEQNAALEESRRLGRPAAQNGGLGTAPAFAPVPERRR